MFFSNANKERGRYYLLPGMGGPAARRKQKKFLKWSIATALIFSAILAVLMYWLDRPKPF